MRPRTRSVALALALLAGSLGGCEGGNGDGPGGPAVDGQEPSASDGVERTLDEVPPLDPSVDDYPEALVALTRDGAPTLELPVKLADTPELRQHGLMEVPELPEGTGMLFVFDAEHEGAFWMKDTLVPLDIAFADASGEIVTILAMDPCEEDPCPTYAPDAPYEVALEVAQGWLDSVGVEVGEQLSWQERRTG